MIKKVCLVFLALVVVLLAAAGVAWKLNGERWLSVRKKAQIGLER